MQITMMFSGAQMPMDTPATSPFSVLHQKENPVMSRQTAIQGNVKSKRFLDKSREASYTLRSSTLSYLRPKVSIVKTAGSAKIQLIKPKPSDDKSADTWEKPACTNTVDE
jgi:hypothetical protein